MLNEKGTIIKVGCARKRSKRVKTNVEQVVMMRVTINIMKAFFFFKVSGGQAAETHATNNGGKAVQGVTASFRLLG